MAVDAALIQIFDVRVARPCLTDDIDVGIHLTAGVDEPLEELLAVGRLVGVVEAGIKAESVHTSVKPELGNLLELLARLLGIEVPLGHILRKVRFAGIVAHADDLRGRVKVILGVDLKIFGVAVEVAVHDLLDRLCEERVLRGNVVEHQVDNQLDAALVAAFYQSVKIVKCTKRGVDVVVIFHIIFMIGFRRHDRRQPQAVNAEVVALIGIAVVEIVQLRNDSLQVTDAVAVGITEGLREDFIEIAVFVVGSLRGAFLHRVRAAAAAREHRTSQKYCTKQ